MEKYNFKIAENPGEFEQVHRLNAETFTREIPQHPPPGDGRLVDRFHEDNTYVIAKSNGDGVVGMLAINDRRPFSLDQKLPNLDSHLPPHDQPCELRLLCVEEKYRKTGLFFGLMKRATKCCLANQYDLGLISGHVDRLKLYRQIGFEPFGPVVGSDDARYQPMYLTESSFLERFDELVEEVRDTEERPGSGSISLMPGPVEVAPEVERAYHEKPVSHRSESMEDDVRSVRRKLAGLTGAEQVELLTGSGTLANEVVAAHLARLKGPGLLLSSGEFGQRLESHAHRWDLNHHVLRSPQHRAAKPETVKETLESLDDPSWVWMVHCETSTGVLHPLSDIKRACVSLDVPLFVDCISSIGSVPVDLDGVRMASGVSGKAIGTRPGLAFVCYNGALPGPAEEIPRYLDLSFYAERDGIPFTIASNHVQGLKRAVERFDTDKRYERIRQLSTELRRALTDMGFEIVADRDSASPAVITLDLPEQLDGERVGDELKEEGYLLSYRSSYLLQSNHIQICLMGDLDPSDVKGVLPLLRGYAEEVGLRRGQS